MTRPSPKSQNSPPIQAGSHNEGSVPTRKRFTAGCKTTVRPCALPSNNCWKSLMPAKLQVALSTVSFGVMATRSSCTGSAVYRGKRPLAQTFRFRGIQWGLQKFWGAGRPNGSHGVSFWRSHRVVPLRRNPLNIAATLVTA